MTEAPSIPLSASAIPASDPRAASHIAAFAAGFVAVLVFHQGMLTLLGAAGLTSRTPFPLERTWPFGVPAVWSSAFWGGVWGVLFGLVHGKFPRGSGYWASAILFGAVGPTLVNWLVVAPLKGQPLGGGWVPAAMLTGLLVNGTSGVGDRALPAAPAGAGETVGSCTPTHPRALR